MGRRNLPLTLLRYIWYWRRLRMSLSDFLRCQGCYLGPDLLQGCWIELRLRLWRIEIVLELSECLRLVLQLRIVGISRKLALAPCDEGADISLERFQFVAVHRS